MDERRMEGWREGKVERGRGNKDVDKMGSWREGGRRERERGDERKR